ncbi:hypothetical protein MJO28_017008 [Puccinia striiformis f. sp. tritici]|nr:hypothetical protein MJO28_017008 [Puccinia striiformis f. sp. tritici]
MLTNHVTTPINTGLVSAEVWQQVQTTMLTMLQQGQLPPIPAPIFTSNPVPSLASLIPPDTANLSEVSSADSNASNQDHSDPKGPPSASPQQLISFRPDNNEMDHIEGNSPDDANQDEDNFHPLNRNFQNLQKHVWRPERSPQVFITDHKAALRNALKTVFPDAQANLCTWHLTKNITTHCKTDIKGPKILDCTGKLVPPWDIFISLWKEVTYSKTPDIYIKRYNRLKAFLKGCPSSVLEYLEKNIFPVKELFVVAWACQYPHHWNLDTSPVESGHAYVKTFIKHSTGHLLTVFNSLTLAVDTQLMSVHESIGKDTMKKLVNVPKVFMPLLGHISSFAIKQCKAQFDRLKGDFDPTEPCSQTLMKGVGIPCAHRLAELLETDDGLTSADFHLQWHLKYNPESTATPNVKKNPKGRPSTKKPGYTSTTRDASAFEIVEANIEKKQRANATKLKDAQKASGESKHPVKPTKKRVNKTNVQLGRRPKQNEKNDQSKADEDHDEDKEGDDLPDLPEIGIAPSPGPIKGDQAEDGSTYGEEVDSAALLALLDEKMAVPDLILQVPRHLQSMVKDVFHPHGDGHCGFQCVSRALGYDNDGSDGFLRVRQEMIAEIKGNRPTYLKLQGGEEEVSKIIKGLTMQPNLFDRIFCPTSNTASAAVNTAVKPTNRPVETRFKIDPALVAGNAFPASNQANGGLNSRTLPSPSTVAVVRELGVPPGALTVAIEEELRGRNIPREAQTGDR